MKKNVNKLGFLSVVLGGLIGVGGINAADMVKKLNIPSLPSQAEMKEYAELTSALVAAIKPIISLQYKNDLVKKAQAEKILGMIGLVPNLLVTVDSLKADIPSIPRDSLQVFSTTQGALKKASAEFVLARDAAQLDMQAQKVLAGLGLLQSGLEAPGNYLIELNKKTFEKMLSLFEAVPGLGDKMVTTVGGKQAKISQILNNLFSSLKQLTDRYNVGVKAMNSVVVALLKENAELKEEVVVLRSGASPKDDKPSVVDNKNDAVEFDFEF